MSKTEYALIECDTAEELTTRVNHRLLAGWVIAGGASVSLSETDESSYYVATQAMKKTTTSNLIGLAQIIGLGLLLGVAMQCGIKLADWTIPDPPVEILSVVVTGGF